MWVVVVGIVPLIIEWANLKYQISDLNTQKKVIKLFAWSAFSMIVYFVILTSGLPAELAIYGGIPVSIIVGKYVAKLVVTDITKTTNTNPVEAFIYQWNSFKIVMLIALLVAILNIVTY